MSNDKLADLKTRDHARLLKLAREIRMLQAGIKAEFVRPGGKIAELLGDHDFFWWKFYELTLPEHVALFICLMDWQEDIARIAKSDDSLKAILDFAEGVLSDDRDRFSELSPEQRVSFVNLLVGMVYSLEAMTYYSLSLHQLLAKARDGNTVAFLRAVSIDRAVIATDVGQQLIACAQLGQDETFLSALFDGVKDPHSGRRQYLDLRLMHRVLAESAALKGLSRERVLEIVEELGLYGGKREDPVKGLRELFRSWEKEAAS